MLWPTFVNRSRVINTRKSNSACLLFDPKIRGSFKFIDRNWTLTEVHQKVTYLFCLNGVILSIYYFGKNYDSRFFFYFPSSPTALTISLVKLKLQRSSSYVSYYLLFFWQQQQHEFLNKINKLLTFVGVMSILNFEYSSISLPHQIHTINSATLSALLKCCQLRSVHIVCQRRDR